MSNFHVIKLSFMDMTLSTSCHILNIIKIMLKHSLKSLSLDDNDDEIICSWHSCCDILFNERSLFYLNLK